jgi:tetratricopeptide (TPR) repeat protein
MWKICQKTLALFNKFEAGDHYHIGFISDFAKFFKLPLLSLWLILPFGIAGIAINIFRSKKMLSLCAVFFLYGLPLIGSFPTSRFRLPLLIILIPSAVVGVNNLFSSIKTRQLKKTAVYSAIAIGFFIVEFLPVNGTDDMTAYYNTHALILSSKGLKEEAMHYWEMSSSMNKSYSSFANLSLAEAYLRMRDREKALAYLDKIPDSSFAAADKYALKGDFFAIRKQIQKAISAYERSLEINSGGIKVRQKLIRIYRKTDKKRALQEYKKLQYIASFYKRH